MYLTLLGPNKHPDWAHHVPISTRAPKSRASSHFSEWCLCFPLLKNRAWLKDSFCKSYHYFKSSGWNSFLYTSKYWVITIYTDPTRNAKGKRGYYNQWREFFLTTSEKSYCCKKVFKDSCCHNLKTTALQHSKPSMLSLKIIPHKYYLIQASELPSATYVWSFHFYTQQIW